MSEYSGVEIAIIGMSGHFPGANNINEFWENLKNGKESISFFTDEELKEEGVPENHLTSPQYVKANAYVEGKEYFDSAFFEFLPAEAKMMDPQIRLFVQACWEAIEDAGYDANKNEDKIGLFAGGSNNNNWENYSILSNMEKEVDDFTASQLRDITFLCSKISYLFNLQGPSIYLNTACSTSLVAVQRACMSLLLRECKMALAGGVSIYNHSKRGYFYEEGMINSPDGHCRTFDSLAQGTVSGEGLGVVVLKRLEDAIADGDNIHAIIRGSSINNDGSRKISYSAPSIEGQSQSILKAMKMAKVSPESISYIEAHGTATPLGDPNEVEALNLAFGKSKEKYCALGAVKSNIGHLDAAAGIAGLIKAVLAIKHKQIPATLNYKNPNPKINFENSPFYVNNKLIDWSKFPLRAGVSSFGIGGTNAHVILEQAPEPKISSPEREFQLLLFSAKTPEALQRNVANFAEHIRKNENINLADAAYTLHSGRSAFQYRHAIVSNSIENALTSKEENFSVGGANPVKVKNKTVFMFSGQGSQYVNMCKDLYYGEKIFREAVDQCFQIIKNKSGQDFKSLLFNENDLKSENLLDNTAYTQPLLFVIEYSLSRLIMEWGIVPSIMIGHSLGEYVAACISGLFKLEDALTLVLKRGELMQSVAKGTMLSISISEQKLKSIIKEHSGISIAAINSTELCVVSGEVDPINQFQSELTDKGYSCKQLRTSHAFHSSMMDTILNEFESEVKKVKMGVLQIPLISNLTGQEVTNDEISQPEYWVKHLREPVLFSNGIENLCNKSYTQFIEIGPGKSLSTLVKSNSARARDQKVVNLVRHVNESVNDLEYLLSAIAQLWATGTELSYKGLYNVKQRKKVSLPTYSFDKIKYPVHVDASAMIASMITNNPLRKEEDISNWIYGVSWKLAPKPLQTKAICNDKCILVFVDDLGVCDTFISKNKESDVEIIIVRQGNNFIERSSTFYEIDATREEDYTELVKRLVSHELKPDRIIHGWAITQLENENEASTFYKYLFSIHILIKLFRPQGWLADLHMVALSSGLHPVLDTENISAEKSLAIAFLKVVSQEYPSLNTSHIDISIDEINNDETMDVLWNEIVSENSAKLVSLRHSRKWEPAYENVKAEIPKNDSCLKNGGVYLITGGLGDVGHTLSKYLLQYYHAKIILLGRSELDPSQNNPSDSEKEEVVQKKLQRLEILQKEGQVLYFNCDISCAAEMAQVVNISEEKFGAINGVIHAAGIISGNSINTLDTLQLSDFEDQFSPKIAGLKTLYEIFGERDLDFCVLTSSLSTILGGIGFGAYAAANIFMDYYVRSFRAKGQLKNWLCLNLDGIDFKSNDSTSINADELIEVFKYGLNLKDHSQLLISTSPIDIKLKNWVNQNKDYDFDTEKLIQVADDLPQENGKVNTTERLMLELWKDFFGKSEINLDDDFFDIGGDSLKALTMITRIHKVFNVELSITDFFKNTTISKLSNFINDVSNDVSNDNLKTYSSIPEAEKSEHYPLSSSQKRQYFLQESDRGSLAYNMPQTVKLNGELDRKKLVIAFEKLNERHESLRTYFAVVEGEVVQKISEDIEIEIEYFRSSEAGAAGIVDEFIRPFDLSLPALIRVGLVKTSPNVHILIVDMHHIISDGVSQAVLIKDFMSFYNDETLPSLQLQYKDYAVWQQGIAHQQTVRKQKEFWKQEFENEITRFDLPTDFPRPRLKSYAGSSLNFELNKEETIEVQNIADREGVTVYMILLSVYNILLSKLSNKEDVIIGTGIAGRPHADLENMIGMFVNTLPLRNFPKGEVSFKSFLESVRTKTLACFDNQNFQYEELIEELDVERDTSRNPIFEVMFSYQNFEEPELIIPGLKVEPYVSSHAISKFDLTLTATKESEQIMLNFEYCTDLFKEATIQRFISYFKKIVKTIIRDINVRLLDIEIISDDEKQTLLYGYNETNAIHVKETFLSLFESQANSIPDSIAISYDSGTLSYYELKRSTDQVSTYLRRNMGLQVGDRIGVLLDRSVESIVIALGILKGGGVYVPISPENSQERINSILQDAKVTSVIINGTYFENKPDNSFTVIDLNEHRTGIEQIQPVAFNKDVTGSDTASIMYTFGPHNSPRGIVLEHQVLANRLFWIQQEYKLTENDLFLHRSSVGSDPSVLELFWPLIAGASVYLCKSGSENSTQEIIETIEEKGITTIHFTPTLLSAFLKKLEDQNSSDNNNLNSLRQIFCGGEIIRTTQVDLFRKFSQIHSQTKLIYLYSHLIHGEALYYEYSMDKMSSVQIGKSIGDTKLYILDSNKKLSPEGVCGELHVASSGLASGFFNNISLTEKYFIENPFIDGERVYETGDLVRLNNGNIELIGRVNNEIKKRGIIVYLDELEERLSDYPKITECVVLAIEREGNPYLVAYYVSEEEIDEAEIKTYLYENLQCSIIPDFYMSLDKMPLTHNGKLDRRRLPRPDRILVLPSGKFEEKLTELWAEVFQIDKNNISVDDNFFDLGLQSLKATKLIFEMRKEFEYEITITDIFKNPDIRSLSKYVQESVENRQWLKSPSKKDIGMTEEFIID